jgi:hypothetical protein
MRVYLAPKVLVIDKMGYLLLDEMARPSFSNWLVLVTSAAASS